MGPQHTFNSPHLPTLTFPYISPTPHHTFLHFLSYFFPHPFFLPPHPNTFSYYPHISLHLLKVWRSYHVTKLPCGEINFYGNREFKVLFRCRQCKFSMYESVAKLPCGEVTVAKLPCGEVTGNPLYNVWPCI